MAFQRSHRLNLLRLVVLLLVALAGIKFLFRDSFTLELHKHVNKDSGFWGDTGDIVQDIIPQSQVLEVPAAKIIALKQKQQVPRDVSATEMRLVHLDLKGAAPRVSYLEQVFPLLSQLGANGVLVEYEDMFPFKGELEILRSPYAYSEEDIERIQQLAEQHKLEVVPLVQTFGHVEFILKHEKYQHLREVERFPNSFNPHVPDTLALLKSILSQVIEKHRRSTWIHIGADEVFHLGEGMDSKNWMSHNKGDVGTMYLKHIKEVLSFLTAQYWGLRVLMWDDMLRKISVGALRESGIAKHVSPVVWFYAPDFEAEQIVPFLTKYVESGFEAVWFASAFKGTTGPAQAWTPLSYHLKNHLSWLKVMQAVPRLAPLRLQGVVLTGWQRYDHYSVLCELLPVSIPSLAICLQTLVNGGFTEEAKRKVLDVLGLESVQLEQSTCEGRGAFPGVEIYHMVEQVNGHLKESILKALEEESAIKGWFSPYHRKHQFGNPRNMESFGSKVLKLHDDWESFVRDLRAQLDRIYFPDTVEEWMEENVNPYLDQLRDLGRNGTGTFHCTFFCSAKTNPTWQEPEGAAGTPGWSSSRKTQLRRGGGTPPTPQPGPGAPCRAPDTELRCPARPWGQELPRAVSVLGDWAWGPSRREPWGTKGPLLRLLVCDQVVADVKEAPDPCGAPAPAPSPGARPRLRAPCGARLRD